MQDIQTIKEAFDALMMQRSSLDMDEGTDGDKLEDAENALDRLAKKAQRPVEELAGQMYTAYCEAVGGVAYDGKPLPAWPEFSTDPTKQKQAAGWLAAAKVAALNATVDTPALTPQERAKGRSENYHSMSSEDQWAEDKRLGILDWDGK